MTLVWTPAFKRTVKRLIRQNPTFRSKVEKTLERLAENPFHPNLKTHKLKGDLQGRWSCSIDYSNRLIFKFVVNADSQTEEILLLALGSHDAVY